LDQVGIGPRWRLDLPTLFAISLWLFDACHEPAAGLERKRVKTREIFQGNRGFS